VRERERVSVGKTLKQPHTLTHTHTHTHKQTNKQTKTKTNEDINISALNIFFEENFKNNISMW
jgi:hypothetical protein